MENNFQEMPALKPISEMKMDSNEDAGSMHGKNIIICAKILEIDFHIIITLVNSYSIPRGCRSTNL